MYGRSGHLLIWLVALLEGCGCDLRRLLRRQRNLLYPDPRGSETKVQVLFGLGLPMEGEVSMTLGYVLKCNYNLPYNSSDYTSTGIHDVEAAARLGSSAAAAAAATAALSPGANKAREKQPSGGVTRWSFYRILERVLDKSCMLRAVCEAAATPLDRNAGLLGQLLQALLTPSGTAEDYQVYGDREYHAAESQGKFGACEIFRKDCEYSPLDYFTEIADFL